MAPPPAAGDVAGQMRQFMGSEKAPVAAGGDSAEHPEATTKLSGKRWPRRLLALALWRAA
jgi:hypothetical protein